MVVTLLRQHLIVKLTFKLNYWVVFSSGCHDGYSSFTVCTWALHVNLTGHVGRVNQTLTAVLAWTLALGTTERMTKFSPDLLLRAGKYSNSLLSVLPVTLNKPNYDMHYTRHPLWWMSMFLSLHLRLTINVTIHAYTQKKIWNVDNSWFTIPVCSSPVDGSWNCIPRTTPNENTKFLKQHCC